ncbi:MAG: 2-oxo acid dehydrogenase subunit E2 [Candidatus Schekmanbacteria bacterium]|nr:MAG: 2-oxo acid dehydrogenase subunit E2 [Candidatus Schekmanbacteria bacterium]
MKNNFVKIKNRRPVLIEPKIKEKIPLKGMRARIAKKMTQSWTSAPRVAEIVLINMEEAKKCADSKKSEGVTINDLIIRSCALALKEFPILNSAVIGEEILVFDNVNIAFAVALDDGLITPVIPEADTLSLPDVAAKRAEVVERVRNGERTPDLLTGGTFTITNLGGAGIELFTPIINFPQCAILGVGKAIRRPVVDGEGNIVSQLNMYASLVFDHRIVDGLPAAKCLGRIKELLENPSAIG